MLIYVTAVVTVHYHADDGYIVLRYVRNILDGFGPVYNPGDPVEGYTSFLWVMTLAALATALRGIDLALLSEVTGTVFGVGVVVMTYLAGRILRPAQPSWAVLAAALVACNAGLVAWATGGLETTLFSLIVVGAVTALLHAIGQGKMPWLAAFLFGVATITRPDGAPIFMGASLWFLYSELKAGRALLSTRTLGWVAIYLVVVLPWFVWRYSYYGFLLPNTAYAKVGSGLAQVRRGVGYVSRWGLMYGYALWSLPAVVLLAFRRDRVRDGLAVIYLTHLAFVTYVGGDGLDFFRFLTYAFPLLALITADGLLATARLAAARLPRAVVGVASVGILSVILWGTARQSLGPTLFPERSRWHEPHSELDFPGDGVQHGFRWFDNYFIERQRAAAEWIESEAAPGATIAATPAGAIAYYSTLDVIDMLGLNDAHIAHVQIEDMGAGRAGHEKGDGAYVLSRRPEFILLGNVAVLGFPLDSVRMEEKLIRRSEHEIWADPSFHRDYERVVTRLNEEGPLAFFTYYRRRDDGRLEAGIR